jgi:Caspase domain/WD40-like Beta Propeller Repeat
MPGRRLALIVAIDEYEDAGLHTLRAPADDAEALAEVLGDSEVGDFEVNTLRNETHWTISQRVEELLSEARLDDFVVLHFSCHGIKDDAGELYLAAKNTRPSLLATTAVEATLINRLIRRSRSQRIVLLLDCCFGGAFERGMTARATAAVNVADQFQQRDQDLGGGRGRVVITASSAMEFAFEGSDLADGGSPGPSVFTGALVEGLKSGAADRDNDGKFSLGEVYDYVFDRVRGVSPNQTPSKFEYGVQGDFVLAKNPNWTVAPGSIPPKLLELANDPYAPTRLGSVADLARLAGGADLPTAAAAWRQLDLMANDDSRQVATAASSAVDALALHVSAASVDLGELNLGARSPYTEVKIEGPPLAAASRVESSLPNVRIRRIDRTIQVEVDTSKAGLVEGQLKIDGPAGSVDVPVTAVVVGDAAVPPSRSSVTLTPAAASERATTAEAGLSPKFPEPTPSPTQSKATAARPDSTRSEGTPPGRSPVTAGSFASAEPSEPTSEAEERARHPALEPAKVQKRRSVPVIAAFAIGGLAAVGVGAFLLFGGGGPKPTGDLAVEVLDGTPSLALSSPLGGELRPVPLDGTAGDPAWGPDRQLVYVRNGGLRIVGADGSGDRTLTDPDSGHLNPSWSMATDRIAFTGPFPGRQGGDAREILVVPGAGGPIQPLTDRPGEDRNPSWSPDGGRIAFVSDRSGNSDVWVMDSDGTDPWNLTEEGSKDFDPAWSPDGSLIAYASNREDGLLRIWVVPVEGGEPRRITGAAAMGDQDPTWSPDGKFLAFHRGSPQFVVVVDLEGNELATIKSGDGSSVLTPSWGP